MFNLPDSFNRIFLYGIDPQNNQLNLPNPNEFADDQNNRDFLTKYVESLKNFETEDTQAIHSVPSVFARPILFYQAFKNEKHPLHKVIVQEWRGLLGIIAFKRAYNFQFNTYDYTIVPPNEIQENRNDTAFRTILKLQRPNPQQEWNRLTLLYLGGTVAPDRHYRVIDGSLIGCTSPWTIFFTPAEYHCPEKVHWSKNGKLYDPLQYFRTSENWSGIAILKIWVQHLLLQFTQWGTQNNEVSEYTPIVRRELESWLRDIRCYDSQIHDLVQNVNVDSHALIDRGIYRFFSKPLTIELQGNSDYYLNSSKQPNTNLLVFSRRGLDPTKAVYEFFYGDCIDTMRMPAKGDSGWKTKLGDTIPIPYIMAEDVFFTPKIAKIETTTDALDLRNEEDRNSTNKFTIPLSSEFFKYFDLMEIIKNKEKLIEIIVNNYGTSVTVKLNIPLKGGDSLKVTKEYRGDTVVEIEVQPALEIWPNFVSDEWKDYMMFCNNKSPNFKYAPLLQNGTTLKFTSNDPNESEIRVWQSELAPIGFAVKDKEDFELGIIARATLPPPNRNDNAINNVWKVGVDFGTSNTAIRVKEGNDKIDFEFKIRNVLLSKNVQFEPFTFIKSTQGNSIQSLFPTLSIKNSFTSVIQALDDQFWNVNNLKTHYLTVTDDKKYVIELLTHPERYPFEPDIKWTQPDENQPGEQHPINQYLSLLMRYILCEAYDNNVTEIHLAWSYPLSLHKKIVVTMELFWNTLILNIVRPPSLTIKVKPKTSESAAIARYLVYHCREANFPATDLNIIVDMGGGSTDIAFSRSYDVLSQLSIQFGGRDIFRIITTKKQQEFLHFLRDATRSENLIDVKHNYAPLAVNTSLYSTEDVDAYQHSVIQYMNLNQNMFTLQLRTIAYLFVSGIAYFLGLRSQEFYKHEGGSKQIKLFFCGKASQLITWFAVDRNDAKRIITSYFNRGLWEKNPDSVNSDEYQIELHGKLFNESSSHQLKEEVVTGLLCDALENEDQTTNGHDRTFMGEIGWRIKESDGNYRVLDWKESVNLETIKKLEPPVNWRNLQETQNLNERCFILLFQDFCKQFSKNVSTVDSNSIQNSLCLRNPATVQAMIRDPETGVLQPIFIYELKTMINEYIESVF
ncbi:MAG: hypothetical protein N2450_09660 [bacterium]|nr:hypothetical protein [bacterium]